jgi:hypothetical protein
MRRYRAVARWWDKRNAYKAFVGRPERKRPLGRTRRRRILWLALVGMVVGLLGYSAV